MSSDTSGDSNSMASVREEKPKCMWKPNADQSTNIGDFQSVVNQTFGLNLETYEELRKWSVNQHTDFWEMFWKFANIVHSHPYDEVPDFSIISFVVPNESKPMEEVPEWFHGAHLNFAENLLRFDDEKVALYTAGEGQEVKTVTFHQLRKSVALLASALKNLGIKKGDRVV
ncbi:hypothetical protein pdam_00006621, partial [Pocillopora damicornis]